MDPKIAGWYAFGTVVITALLSALRPDNTFLPFSLSTRGRVVLTFALGVVMVGAQTYFKQPISDAALAALGAMGTGFATAGAPRAVAGMVLCLFLMSTSACSLFTPKRINGIVKITECVLAHRSLPPEQVALTCGLENPQEVVDIIAGEDRRLASARAIGEAEGRTLGCKR
jgi:hypothetical protein